MSEDLRIKPPCLRDDALAVVRRLQESGHVAYFAGGCVRDLLMGLEPKDYDVATDAPPARVRELFSRTQAVGAAFGVVLVRMGQSVVEVATFRTDAAYHDGRRPSAVTFTDAEHDAHRRDFTINGLFLDPLADRVIDYVGGRADIEARVLRAIGEADHRFEEDHLRLLRAVRFAARFGLSIEAKTAAAIGRHANRLPRISPERIADELRLMLTTPTRTLAYEMLWGFGLMAQVVRFAKTADAPRPDLAPGMFVRLEELTAKTRRREEVREETNQTSSFAPIFAPSRLRGPTDSISFGLAMAGTMADVIGMQALLTKEGLRATSGAMRKALRWSNDEAAEFQSAFLNLYAMLGQAEPTVAQMKRFLAAPASDSSRALLAALRATGQFAERIAWLTARLAELEQTEFAPAPLITGDDLTAAGLAPGPVFKRVLNEAYDAQLEGRIKTRDEAMGLAMKLAKGNEPRP